MGNRFWRFVGVSFTLNSLLIVVSVVLLSQVDRLQFNSTGFWWLLGLLLMATGLESLAYWRVQHQAQTSIDRMDRKLRQMASSEFPTNILLDNDDPLYDLAQAVNKLETYQQHQAHHAARQEQELMMILRYLPVGVMVIDHHRQVQLSNPALVDILEQPISRVAHLYTNDIQLYQLSHLIEDAITTGKTQRGTVHIGNVTHERVVEATAVYIASQRAEFQVLLILYDITEVHLIEQMQSDFVSNASHELKTPITAIAGFTETLLSGAKDDPETLTQFLQIIDAESQRLIALIQDVLSLSRIQSQTVEAEPMSSVHLQTMLAQELQLLQQTAKHKKVQLINQIDSGVTVQTAPKHFGQIVRNLLSNAIKYNRNGGHVWISYQADKKQWSLQVKDDGIGIAAEDQQRIFERFYRVSASRSQQVVSGTGLGLAIVHELVTNLDGQIQVASQRGVGTTMTVTFPLHLDKDYK